MTEKKFSCKEAISHGSAMTRKYALFLLGVGAIYLLYNIPNIILQNRAGSSRMTKSEVRELYKERSDADHLYQYFQDAGYINKFGHVEDKLQDLPGPTALVLTPDLEGDRDKIFKFLDEYRYRLPFPKPVYYFLSLILWLGSTLMSVGLLRIFVHLSRDQKPEISELYSNGSLIVNYLLSSICYGLAVLGGLILLIIPGLIFSIMFGLHSYLIVDKGMGPIEALKRSRVITKGSRGQLALMGLWLTLFNLVGALCLLVGLIFTLPASAIAMAYVYDLLENPEHFADDQPPSPGQNISAAPGI